MALAIDGSSPAAVTVSGVSTTPISTASFSPPAGSYLVVAFSANTASGVTPGTPTITDNLGTPLTYNFRQWKTRATAPTANGQVAIWTAPVVAGGAMVVSVTTGTASGNQQAALKVWVFTGQDPSTPVGTSGKNASTSASSISQSYTGSGTGGWGLLVTCDWSALGNFTAGTGCTVDATGTVPTTQFSYAFARRTTADDTNGGANSLNINAAGSSTDLSWAWVEMLPPAGALTFPPNRPRRRFMALSRIWRSSRAATPPVAQTVLPVAAHQARRTRGLMPRRARAVTPVPAQVFLTNPPIAKLFARARRAIVAATRRQRAFHPTATRTATHQQALRPRLKYPKPARGHSSQVVPAQVAVTSLVFPPRGWRARIKGLRRSSARIAVLPPQQATPIQARRPALRQVIVKRRRVAAPPLEQVAPPFVARARAKVMRTLRRWPVAVVPAQPAPPQFASTAANTRRKLFRARARRSANGPLVVTVIPAGPDIDIVVGRPRTAWTVDLTRAWTARTVRSAWATDNADQSWTTGGPE